MEKKHGNGNALRLLAQKLGRAVYDMRTRPTAFDLALCLRPSESRAGARAVSLATQGMSLPRACRQC